MRERERERERQSERESERVRERESERERERERERESDHSASQPKRRWSHGHIRDTRDVTVTPRWLPAEQDPCTRCVIPCSTTAPSGEHFHVLRVNFSQEELSSWKHGWACQIFFFGGGGRQSF